MHKANQLIHAAKISEVKSDIEKIKAPEIKHKKQQKMTIKKIATSLEFQN